MSIPDLLDAMGSFGSEVDLLKVDIEGAEAAVFSGPCDWLARVKNIAIELRYAQGGPQQLPELAAELIRLKVDVIFASGDHAPKVAQQANVFSSPILASLHREIIAFAAEYRLPAIYQWKEHVEAGGLVSYGPGLAAIWRQSAIIVAKVLKGVKPADLPVEQPTKFELALNLRTAKSLELTIPPAVLLRADEVIE